MPRCAWRVTRIAGAGASHGPPLPAAGPGLSSSFHRVTACSGHIKTSWRRLSRARTDTHAWYWRRWLRCERLRGAGRVCYGIRVAPSCDSPCTRPPPDSRPCTYILRQGVPPPPSHTQHAATPSATHPPPPPSTPPLGGEAWRASRGAVRAAWRTYLAGRRICQTPPVTQASEVDRIRIACVRWYACVVCVRVLASNTAAHTRKHTHTHLCTRSRSYRYVVSASMNGVTRQRRRRHAALAPAPQHTIIMPPCPMPNGRGGTRQVHAATAAARRLNQ